MNLPPPAHWYPPSSLDWTLRMYSFCGGPVSNTTLNDVITGFPSFVHTTVPVRLHVNWTPLPARATTEALIGVPGHRCDMNNHRGNHGDNLLNTQTVTFATEVPYWLEAMQLYVPVSLRVTAVSRRLLSESTFLCWLGTRGRPLKAH